MKHRAGALRAFFLLALGALESTFFQTLPILLLSDLNGLPSPDPPRLGPER